MAINHIASPARKNLSPCVFEPIRNRVNIPAMHTIVTADVTRRVNLQSWAESFTRSLDAADVLGMSHSQFLQIAGPNPTRKIGTTLARKLEISMNKPPGWLDTPIEPPLADKTLDRLLRRTRLMASEGMLNELQTQSLRNVMELITETARNTYTLPRKLDKNTG